MTYRTTPTPSPLVFVHDDVATAMDPDTGQTRWTVALKTIISRMAFMDNRVFFLDNDSVVHCLDAASGTVLGKVQVGDDSDMGVAMLADGNRLFVATTGAIACLSSEGQILWQTKQDAYSSRTRHGLGILGNIAQADFNER